MSFVDSSRVAAIIREVAQSVVLPRFNHLGATDVREKRPGDLVTIADTEAEREISRRLTELLPGSVVVGEEGVAADPGLLGRLDGDAPVWIIDPVDGTANFARGNELFAVVIALVVAGRTVQGWILDPVADRMAVAEAGAGAWLEGRRLTISTECPLPEMVGSAGSLWRRNKRLAAAVRELINQGSAAHDYLALAEGRLQFAYFRRLHPWDHAAGVLLHREAGGFSALLDGTPYRPRPVTVGMLLTPDRATWDALAPLIDT